MMITARRSASAAMSSRNRASSEPRPGSTAWTRPPAATMRGDQVRDPLRGERPEGQPLPVVLHRAERASRRAGPRRRARSPGAGRRRPRRPRRAGRRRPPGRRGGSRPGRTICSTSVSRCELRMTVAPRSRAARTMARTSVRPIGSSAEVGSSRRIRSGSPSSATPRPSRCCMPFEKPATGSPARSGQADPLRGPRSTALARRAGAGPASSAWRSSTSRARSQGW